MNYDLMTKEQKKMLVLFAEYWAAEKDHPDSPYNSAEEALDDWMDFYYKKKPNER